jgi:hypothetical protein
LVRRTEYTFLYPGNNLDGPYTIPFDWYFYGELVSQYKIAHDGYITFANTNGPSVGSNTSLPDPGGPNNAIYALWDEFGPDAVISMKTYGESPTRAHTITWASMGAGWDGPVVNDLQLLDTFPLTMLTTWELGDSVPFST